MGEEETKSKYVENEFLSGVKSHAARMTKWCENHFPFMATPLLTLFQFVKVGENTESNYSETISVICAACWPLHPSNKNVLNFEHPAVRASMMQTPVRIACHHARKIANECGTMK